MAKIDKLDTLVIDVPTERGPESDGTATWHSTTMVLAQVRSAGVTGTGYSYVTGAAAKVISDLLAPCVEGADAFQIPALARRMVRAVRNQGSEGIAACAIAAVDTALWDLKAKLLDVSVSNLLGAARGDIPVYASGGFTSTTERDLEREVTQYRDAGYRRVKIKIGQPVSDAIARASLVRSAIGPDIELMVDGNGAFTRKEAVRLADALETVSYFEEPVSSDDLDGLRAIRNDTLLDIAAGEYAYDARYLRRMLEADAVDILQADATRCLGVSGFLQADALADAFGVPLSAHCAPAIHAHVGRAARRLVHIEHFYDHVRIEGMIFDGAPALSHGMLTTDESRAGFGLELRMREAKRFAA